MAQGPNFLFGVEGQMRMGRPTVAVSKEVSHIHAARYQRLPYLIPELPKVFGPTKRQRQSGVNQIGSGQFGQLFEIHKPRRQHAFIGAGTGRGSASDCLWLAIYCQDLPASPNQLLHFDSRAAAQVDGLPASFL